MRANLIPDKIGVIIETSAPLDSRDLQDCVRIRMPRFVKSDGSTVCNNVASRFVDMQVNLACQSYHLVSNHPCALRELRVFTYSD